MGKITLGHICCGGGGDIFGAKLAGVKSLWAFDYSEAAVNTVKINHADVETFIADIRNINPLRLSPVDIVICGIPCQPFTLIGRRLQEKDKRDISRDVARVIKRIRPQFIIFENVREYQNSKGIEVLNSELSDYKINWKVLNVADYGVPQQRKRLFGIASLFSLVEFPAATHTEHSDLFDQRPSWVRFGAIRDGQGMKPLSVKAIRGVLKRLRRHIKKSSGFSVQVIGDDDMMMTVLGVMWRGSGTSSHSTLIWDNGMIRNVSLIEARRAQGFPDSYVFCGTQKEQWQQIANAIPSPIAKILIETIKGL